jgi:RimJ/RimL family protein N-acetyltransferase
MEVVPIVLETPRLLLRKLRPSDLDAYALMCADPEVMRHIGTGASLDRNASWRSLAAMLGHWQMLGYGMWAIEIRQSGAFAGRVGFLDPPGWPGFELGWLLGREHWGRGYASEAARAALDYAFETLKRDRVVSLIRPGNERSVRVAQRIGERPAGEADMMGAKALVYEARR